MIIQSYNNNQTAFNGKCEVTQIINKKGKLVKKIKTIRTNNKTDLEIIDKSVTHNYCPYSISKTKILQMNEQDALSLSSLFESIGGIKFKKNSNKLLTVDYDKIELKDVDDAEDSVKYVLTGGVFGKNSFISKIRNKKSDLHEEFWWKVEEIAAKCRRNLLDKANKKGEL